MAKVRREKAVERDQEFIDDIKKWQKLEDVTIKSSEEIMKKTDNQLIQVLMGAIKRDSEKHKEILQLIHDVIAKSYTLRPDELAEMSHLLEKHLAIEKESIEVAEKAYHNSRLFVLRHLITYILEDERKHHKIISQLDDFKRHLYPYG